MILMKVALNNDHNPNPTMSLRGITFNVPLSSLIISDSKRRGVLAGLSPTHSSSIIHPCKKKNVI